MGFYLFPVSVRLLDDFRISMVNVTVASEAVEDGQQGSGEDIKGNLRPPNQKNKIYLLPQVKTQHSDLLQD